MAKQSVMFPFMKVKYYNFYIIPNYCNNTNLLRHYKSMLSCQNRQISSVQSTQYGLTEDIYPTLTLYNYL